jgi:hypothetical protein
LASQDVAAQRRQGNDYAALIGDLARLIASVAPEEDFLSTESLLARAAALRDGFAADYARIAEAGEDLTGADFAAYGADTTAFFDKWEAEGGGPALTATVAFAIDHFGLSIADGIVRAAMMAAILAEYPNDLPYHGNEHYRKVLFHAIRLMATNNDIAPKTGGVRLSDAEIAKMLAACCIHDLGHKGGDNLRDGVYTPGYMEQRSFNIARPYLAAAGAPEEDLRDIETIVFCTDITFFAGENSPCLRLKKIFKHYFWGDKGDDIAALMLGKLRRYEGNKPLVLMAMILHEADIASSAGLSYDQTIRETLSIMGERGVTTAGPRTVLAFLREQLGETLFTDAGKQIFGRVMQDVIARAEADIAAGRELFAAPDNKA